MNYVTNYSYDILGNLLCVEQRGTASSSSPNCTTPTDNSYGGNWRVRKFHYDSLGRLLDSRNPESGLISYTYDANGNVTSKTSPLQNTTVGSSATVTMTYYYDALNRLTLKYINDGMSPWTHYNYDESSNSGINLQNYIGRLTSSSTNYPQALNYNQMIYDHDAMGRTWKVWDCRAGMNSCPIAQYGYNLDGSTAYIQNPVSGNVAWYSYDSAGRMTCVASGLGCTGTKYKFVGSFWPNGAPHEGVVGVTGTYAGTSTSAYYNNRLQLYNLWAAAANASNIKNIYFGHNEGTSNNGNVTWTENLRDENRSTSNYYDALNRLTASGKAVWVANDCATNYYQNASLAKQWAQGFSYDAWGNLLAINTTQCSTPAFSSSANQANQLNAVTGMQHDAAGNVMNDGNHAYVFDAENRIATAAGTGYQYDAAGIRVRKVVPGTSTFTKDYWYGVNSAPLTETDGSQNLTAEYIFFGGERVARRDFPSNTLHYYFTDQIGSGSTITSATGVIEEESDFYPFGGEREYTMNASVANHFKYTGKERDPESGLDYFGARYYGSSMGRWLSPDWGEKPMAIPYAQYDDPQSLNLYGYVRNNPITHIDADGHWPTDTHSIIYRKAFPGLSEQQLARISGGSENQDVCRTCQTHGNAYKHAMRAPGQDVAEAKAQTGKYIGESIGKAGEIQQAANDKAKCNPCGVNNLSDKALDAFTPALHAVSDKSSPTHTDVNGNPREWIISDYKEHVNGESPSHMTDQQMDRAVADVQQAFGLAFGPEVLKQATTHPTPQSAPTTPKKEEK